MKKTILITILIAALLLTMCTGCAKKAAENYIEELGENLEDMIEDAQDIDADETTEDMNEDVSNDVSNDISDDVSTDTTPAASYDRFLSAKNTSYDIITEKLEDNPELFMTAGMELLAMAMIDLQAIDLTFVNADDAASEAAAAMMGFVDLKVDYNGENFGVSYTGAEGTKISSNGKYDAASDSLSCTWTKDGAETFMLEYTSFGAGYAGQYYIIEGEKATVIKVLVDGENTAIGMGEAGAKPSSIYKSAPADFSFVEDCASVYVIVDGECTYKSQGEETSF